MEAMVAIRLLLGIAGAALVTMGIGAADEIVPPERVLFRVGDQLEWANPEATEEGWRVVSTDERDDGWRELDAGSTRVGITGWYRLYFPIPASAGARNWMVSAGFVGNLSEAYWNGKPIGGIGARMGDTILIPPQRTVHTWSINPDSIRPSERGENVLAIRVQNVIGAGGMLGGPVGLYPVEVMMKRQRSLELGREVVVMLVASFAFVWALVFTMVRLLGDATQPWLFAAGIFAASGGLHLLSSQFIAASDAPGGIGWLVGFAILCYWTVPILSLWMIRGLCEGKGRGRELIATIIGLALVLAARSFGDDLPKVVLTYGLLLVVVGAVMTSRAWSGWRRGSVAAPAVLVGMIFLAVSATAQISLFAVPWLKLAALVWQPMDLGIVAAVASVGGTLLRRYSLSRKREHRLAREVIESGRRERARIGRHLHDGVAQDLQYLLMTAKRLRKSLPDSADAGVEALVEGLGDAIGEVRRAAEDLQPLALRGASLREALETLAAKLSVRHGVEVRVSVGVIPELTDSEKDGIFRAAQEAAHNACRHAQATEVEISISGEEDGIVTRVTDDGRGFDPHGLSGERMGLKFLRDQAELSGGELMIDSAAGKGTRLRYRLPLERRGGG